MPIGESNHDDAAPRGRYLRYEFSRLATLRNLLLAAVIALACVGVVFVVAYYTGPRPQPAPALSAALPAPAGATAPGLTTPGPRLIPPTPEILAQLPPDPAPVVYHVPRNLQGAAREKYVRKLEDQAGLQPGPWARYSHGGCRAFQEDAQGNLIEPCPSVAVERDQAWGHTVSFSADGQHRYHTYTFKYACGHTALVTPDPYRDLMFADPAGVAQQYACRLCPSCQSLREYQDTKAQAGRTPQPGSGGQAGHG